MSTNALIGIKKGTVVENVYLHWDGDEAIDILKEHYNSDALAQELVDMGDMSSLGASIDCPEGHAWDKPVRGYAVFYGRDRKEEGTEKTIETEQSMKDAGIQYGWLYESGKGWIAL